MEKVIERTHELVPGNWSSSPLTLGCLHHPHPRHSLEVEAVWTVNLMEPR